MSEPNKIRKWVVEKFDGISPGLIDTNVIIHCMDIWNCRYLEFYQGPMTVYLPLYSTILSVSFFYEVPLESVYNPYIIDITTISFYAVSASSCQCLIRPVQKPKVSWFFRLFFHWLLNYTRGREFGREISKIHRVRQR